MPIQTQEDDQPPHAQEHDTPELDPWVVLPVAGTNEPRATAPTPAVATVPPPQSPPLQGADMNDDTQGTLLHAVRRAHARMRGNDDQMRREWAWQREVAGSTPRAKVFREQALAGSLRLFAFMQAGSPMVNIFHSAATYCDPVSADPSSIVHQPASVSIARGASRARTEVQYGVLELKFKIKNSHDIGIQEFQKKERKREKKSQSTKPTTGHQKTFFKAFFSAATEMPEKKEQ